MLTESAPIMLGAIFVALLIEVQRPLGTDHRLAGAVLLKVHTIKITLDAAPLNNNIRTARIIVSHHATPKIFRPRSACDIS